MKHFLIGLSLLTLSACNWSFKMTNAEQVFESTITIVPVEEYKK